MISETEQALPSKSQLKKAAKRLHKTTAEVCLDDILLSSLTKIEISPLTNCYALTLRFVLSDDFNFPELKDGANSILSFKHPNLPQIFKFKVEYVDLAIEATPIQTELSLLLRGRRFDEKKIITRQSQSLIA